MKLIDTFDIKKNYKLYRLIQKIVCPKIGVKEQYLDFEYEVDNRKIPIRIFDPKKAEKLIIYIHGGGWMSGDLDTHSSICYLLAKETNRKVISIGYRLAPEYPFPNGFDDCYLVVKSIMNNIEEFNITWEDVTLMGDSAGGNLSAAVSQKALDDRDFRVGHQVLIYPAVQTDYTKYTKYKSVINNSGKGFLTQKQLHDYINIYIPKFADLSNPYVAPILSKKMFGLPKTLIITGSLDPLRDEGIAYAKKLKRHLVLVKHYDLDGAIHGFFTNILDKKYTTKTIELIKEFIGE